MPIYESTCLTDGCANFQKKTEWFARNRDEQDPICPLCTVQAVRVKFSRFAAPFTGTLSRYDEPGYQTRNDKDGGHIAYRTQSTRLADGSPEPVLIRTVADQRKFCRDEGLVDPGDVNKNYRSADDGLKSSGDTAGLSGQWV